MSPCRICLHLSFDIFICLLILLGLLLGVSGCLFTIFHVPAHIVLNLSPSYLPVASFLASFFRWLFLQGWWSCSNFRPRFFHLSSMYLCNLFDRLCCHASLSCIYESFPGCVFSCTGGVPQRVSHPWPSGDLCFWLSLLSGCHSFHLCRLHLASHACSKRIRTRACGGVISCSAFLSGMQTWRGAKTWIVNV